MEATNDKPTLFCSFCGKSQREVRKLIAGPKVFICDECIGLCNDIMAKEIDREEGKKPETIRKLSSGMIEFRKRNSLGNSWELLNPRYILRVGWGGINTTIKLVTEEVIEIDAPYEKVKELLGDIGPGVIYGSGKLTPSADP